MHHSALLSKYQQNPAWIHAQPGLSPKVFALPVKNLSDTSEIKWNRKKFSWEAWLWFLWTLPSNQVTYSSKTNSSLTFTDLIMRAIVWGLFQSWGCLHPSDFYVDIRTSNTLRPKWNGHHFPDDICKCVFFNENVLISINISLKFIPNAPMDNIPVLVQIMAWRRLGDKPLSEPMMVLFTDAYMCHSASMN